MKYFPVLHTERLILREFAETDARALFEILSDEEVNTYLPMFPMKAEGEALEYLKKSCLVRYAVCLKADNIPIGYVQVKDDDAHDFGYVLKKEFWNRGIITEAGRALADAVKEAGLPFITATHDVKNIASGEVMKKIGMTYRYSYEEQWQPKDILVTFRMYQLNFAVPQDQVYKAYWERHPVHFMEG